MYKRTKAGKRILAVILAVAMSVPFVMGSTEKDMGEVQAAETLNNPRRGSNGVVTWDCVYFGRYPQSDATGKQSDPIKWRVLSVNGNDAFLVADCNLDTQFYHTKWEKTTWENCTIRSWLNGYGSSSNARKENYRRNNFISRAFTSLEQNAILTTTVKNPGNAYYKTDGGNDTADKLFLLSVEEVSNSAYGFTASENSISPENLNADPAKTRKNTAYVGAGGSSKAPEPKPEGENDVWWLRTPGEYSQNNVYVGRSGATYREGNYVDVRYGVCPALHLNLSDSDLWSYAGTVGSDGSVTQGQPAPPIKVDTNTGEAYVPTQTEGKDKTVEYQSPTAGTTTVVVPATVKINGTTYQVTSVSDNAFQNNKNIKKVIIGNNVKTIGKNAFRGCTNLQTVTIGKNVKTIGENAFYGCSSLRTVTMGSKVTTIKAKAFYKCTKLKKITIPSKVNKIGKQAFYGCKNLKTITVKTTNLTSKNVGSKAFKGIHSKATVKVPKRKLASYKKLLRSKGVGSKAKIK